MLLTLILVLLGFAAIYSGGMWVATFIVTRLRPPQNEAQIAAIAQFTFHLGLCFITAIGFAGVILTLKGP